MGKCAVNLKRAVTLRTVLGLERLEARRYLATDGVSSHLAGMDIEDSKACEGDYETNENKLLLAESSWAQRASDDHDNSTRLATHLIFDKGRATADAYLNYAGDVDVFEFQAFAETATLTVTGTAAISMYLVNEDGQLVGEIRGHSLTSFMNAPLSAGQHFVLVSATNRSSIGRYFIELFQHTSEPSRRAASPTIDLQATRPARHDVDGNTLNTATPIDDTSGNITVDAVIDYPGDVDVFEFQIRGGNSHLAISSTTPVSAYWIDSSGRLVASIDGGALTDHTSTHLKTGQYFIVVTTKERKSTGRYHFDVIQERVEPLKIESSLPQLTVGVQQETPQRPPPSRRPANTAGNVAINLPTRPSAALSISKDIHEIHPLLMDEPLTILNETSPLLTNNTAPQANDLQLKTMSPVAADATEPSPHPMGPSSAAGPLMVSEQRDTGLANFNSEPAEPSGSTMDKHNLSLSRSGNGSDSLVPNRSLLATSPSESGQTPGHPAFAEKIETTVRQHQAEIQESDRLLASAAGNAITLAAYFSPNTNHLPGTVSTTTQDLRSHPPSIDQQESQDNTSYPDAVDAVVRHFAAWARRDATPTTVANLGKLHSTNHFDTDSISVAIGNPISRLVADWLFAETPAEIFDNDLADESSLWDRSIALLSSENTALLAVVILVGAFAKQRMQPVPNQGAPQAVDNDTVILESSRRLR